LFSSQALCRAARMWAILGASAPQCMHALLTLSGLLEVSPAVCALSCSRFVRRSPIFLAVTPSATRAAAICNFLQKALILRLRSGDTMHLSSRRLKPSFPLIFLQVKLRGSPRLRLFDLGSAYNLPPVSNPAFTVLRISRV